MRDGIEQKCSALAVGPNKPANFGGLVLPIGVIAKYRGDAHHQATVALNLGDNLPGLPLVHGCLPMAGNPITAGV